MPLYDCMFLLKPHVSREALMDLMAKIGKHIYRRNGVLTDMKSFGTVQLGYGIKKLDGRYYQGQLFQMTMMTPPSFNNELHYLNKEDRLLRWLLVKHREQDFLREDIPRRQDDPMLTGRDDLVPTGRDDPMRGDFRNFRITLRDIGEGGGGGVWKEGSSDDDDDDEDDDGDYEYEGDGKEA